MNGTPTRLAHESTGIIVVDHGSRRAESRRRHEDFVAALKRRSGHTIVEAAHMELAEPSTGTAFDACVAAGATTIVGAPYFLWPGNHRQHDLPALAAEAAARHPTVPFLVAAPLGPHPLLMTIVDDRIRYCIAHASGDEPECARCAGTGHCRLRLNEAAHTPVRAGREPAFAARGSAPEPAGSTRDR
jgi:sirohydrochlorin ferrochelatase